MKSEDCDQGSTESTSGSPQSKNWDADAGMDGTFTPDPWQFSQHAHPLAARAIGEKLDSLWFPTGTAEMLVKEQGGGTEER